MSGCINELHAPSHVLHVNNLLNYEVQCELCLTRLLLLLPMSNYNVRTFC
jgi:hypothetical protein